MIAVEVSGRNDGFVLSPVATLELRIIGAQCGARFDIRNGETVFW